MLVLSVLSEESREGKLKARGKIITKRIFLALETMNLVMGYDEGYGPNGLDFPVTFVGARRYTRRYPKPEKQICQDVKAVLGKILGITIDCPDTFEGLDRVLEMRKRNFDGYYVLYDKLRPHLKAMKEAS